MTKTTLLLSIAFWTILSSCNSNAKQETKETNLVQLADSIMNSIDDSLKKIDVLALEQFRKDSIDELQIKGYSVKKVSGKHKYGGYTKLKYQSLVQLIAETKKQSNKEMWKKEELETMIAAHFQASLGGQIRLDIERTTIGAANTEYFTIIIKDKTENEIFRQTLDSDIPNSSQSNGNWWNIALCSVDKKIKAPFYIYIIDALEDEPFKFEVTAIKK